MSARDFDFVQTDVHLIDLEGWNDVLDVMADCAEDVDPKAIRMVANSISRCIRDLRHATGTGPARGERA